MPLQMKQRVDRSCYAAARQGQPDDLRPRYVLDDQELLRLAPNVASPHLPDRCFNAAPYPLQVLRVRLCELASESAMSSRVARVKGSPPAPLALARTDLRRHPLPAPT